MKAKKSNVALITVLVVPLALYFVPYAYALSASPSDTYAKHGDFNGNQLQLNCDTGDYLTGGGSSGGPVTMLPTMNGHIVAGSVPEFRPDGIDFFTSSSILMGVYVICQHTITVAGVGVPEFGSLYSAIALAAVLYFGLTVLRQRRTPMLPATG